MIYLDEAVELSVVLSQTGLTYANVQVYVYKDSATDYVQKTLNTDNWKEVGHGLYVVKFDTIEIDTVGIFVMNVRNGSYGDEFVSERVARRPAYDIVPPSICRVSGNNVDLGGNPDDRPVVYSRLAQVPHVTPGSSIVTNRAITANVDSIGNFYVDLVQSTVVVLEIPDTGIRVQITVPDTSTANLTDLINT